MSSQRMLVSFLDRTHHYILEVDGKWVEKEQLIQANSDGGEEPTTLCAWEGIWDRQDDLPSGTGLFIWEGELEDVDTNDMSLVFKGSWRKLEDHEWSRVKNYLPLWRDPPPMPAEPA